MLTAEEIIDLYGMKPLPDEGGYYVETYRANEQISSSGLPDRYHNGRYFSTAILYLITPDCFSKLHRVKSDEVFHFYLGDPVEMLQLLQDGTGKIITMGTDIKASQDVQTIVTKGTWQGTKLKKGGKFALLGCTVAPGFEFEDYESADQERLIKEYPEFEDSIIMYI